MRRSSSCRAVVLCAVFATACADGAAPSGLPVQPVLPAPLTFTSARDTLHVGYSHSFAVRRGDSTVGVSWRVTPVGVVYAYDRGPGEALVLAARPGIATLTATLQTDSTIRATRTIVVVPAPVVSLAFDSVSVTLRGRGATGRARVVAKDAQGRDVRDVASAVSVEPAGLVTVTQPTPGTFALAAAAAGSGILRATLEGRTATVAVTVRGAGTDSVLAVVGEGRVDVGANDFIAAGAVVALGETPLHGSATVQGTALAYQPRPGFVGRDSVRYLIRSADGALDTGLVRFRIFPRMTVRGVGTPGTDVTAASLNDRSVVVGTVTAAARLPFRWVDGAFTFLQRPAGVASADATAINGAGAVAGFAAGNRPLFWPAGSTTPIESDERPYGPAVPVNVGADGTVLLSDRSYYGAIWKPGAGPLSNLADAAMSRDDAGNTLYNQVPGYGTSHWASYVQLASGERLVIGGFSRWIRGISMNGKLAVVGQTEYGAAAGSRPFRWKRETGTVELVSAYGTWLVSVTRINDADWMLGTVAVPGRPTPAPALLIGGSAVPLEELLSPDDRARWTLLVPTAINNAGVILMHAAETATGRTLPLLLTPTR